VARRDQEAVVLEINDDGPGIPEEVAVIFDPFFTTKEVGRARASG
jgi:signal transduction histidine kinase